MLGLVAAVTVFASGESGFNTYRIPALFRTTKGSLVAFAEARASQADAANNAIVTKISNDDGATWGKMSVCQSPSQGFGGSFNNPCVVENRRQTLVLHFQHYPKDTHEYDVEAGFSGPKVVRGFQTESRDGGISWTAPQDITAEVKPAEAVTIASGPGVGIRLVRGKHKNRLVMPYNYRVGKRWWVYCAYSDDDGRHWKRGARVEQPEEMNANEVQVVELTSGDILLNARNQAKRKERCISLSHDGGATFSPAAFDSRLIDPVCQGSITRLGSGVLAFSNPVHQTKRENGMVRFSWDEGRTWPSSMQLEPGSFQYSCMAELLQQQIGVLYETVVNGSYLIRYQRIPSPQAPGQMF
ncbi:MAG: sialidase family protein [Fimbriimonas sp.]|nr:sialidase family protein [Fimbriimonas sp.]